MVSSARTSESAPQPAARPVRDQRSRVFKVGLALAVVNTLIGAAQPVVTRFGALRLDPLLFCTGVVLVAAVCTLPLLYARGELGPLIDHRWAPRLFAMSITGTVATSLTLVYGLQRIDAVAGVILLQSEPVYSLILATVLVGEQPRARQLLATAAILTGIASVFVATNVFSPVFAAMLVLVTPFFWQMSHVIGLRVMPPLTPACVTGGRFIFAALILTPVYFALGHNSLTQLRDPVLLATVVLTGFFVYFISALTWYGAINRLSLSWTTTLVVPAVPMLSILFAILFLGERASAREIGGILIAIAGILALVLGSDPHRRMEGALQVAEAVHQPLT